MLLFVLPYCCIGTEISDIAEKELLKSTLKLVRVWKPVLVQEGRGGFVSLSRKVRTVHNERWKGASLHSVVNEIYVPQTSQGFDINLTTGLKLTFFLLNVFSYWITFIEFFPLFTPISMPFSFFPLWQTYNSNGKDVRERNRMDWCLREHIFP